VILTETTSCMRAWVGVFGLTLVLTLSHGCAVASEASLDPFERRPAVRFAFDNDTLLGSDDSFTAGWSLQIHSGLDDTWQPGVGKWLGRLPILSDDGEGGRVVRSSIGISQQIFTPRDLTVAEHQFDDTPWAGVLGIHGSWAAFDNQTLSALQIYAGCMGPCSRAERVQKLVHEDREGRLDTADGETIHQALALLSYDPESRTYQWSAHRGDGKALMTTAEIRGDAFVWGFEAPWGRTRFTIRETSEGEWHEVGELTRDGGETWMKILEMTLQRRATAPVRQGGVPR
jgi:hypothetical protein